MFFGINRKKPRIWKVLKRIKTNYKELKINIIKFFKTELNGLGYNIVRFIDILLFLIENEEYFCRIKPSLIHC